MSKVTLNKVIKEYDKMRAIHGVELEINQGEFCVFVGPSGCGKSTLLRMIAGLEEVTDGSIFIGTRDVTKVDAAERGIAMVFQTYALYPHMTVEQNIGFGLKMGGMAKQEVKSKVDEVAKILKLGPYMTRKPKALSGGQRQRVAIGRALVRGPEVFLFDEPLSNLDAELRVDMRVEIARLHQEIGATMVYVTHDQVEAMTLADKIVVLRDGKIEQVGSPMQLYENPNNKFVAGFIGSPAMNFVPAEVQGKHVSSSILSSQKSASEKINAPAAANGKLVMGIRPEHITIQPKEKTLKIDMIEKLGGVTYVYASSSAAGKLVIELKGITDLKRGDRIGVKFDKKNLYFFDGKSEERIR